MSEQLQAPNSAQSQRAPNALLQNRIIQYLEQHEVDTISALARELGAPRPSVSRALHALKSGGYVLKSGTGWILTEVGRDEALLIREQHSEKPKRKDIRSTDEALKVLAKSAKSLEGIARQAQLFQRLLDRASGLPKDDIDNLRLARYMWVTFDELRSSMEPLEELADRMRPLLNKIVHSGEEAESLELDARDRWLLVELAQGIEGTTQALDRLFGEMRELVSSMDKTKSPQNGREVSEVDGSDEVVQFKDQELLPF